jgi:hypothetical protein
VSSVAAGNPLVIVHQLVTNRGVVTVSGMDDCVVGQRAEPVLDRVEDGREILEGATGGARAAVEQGVAGEHCAEFGGEPAHRTR